MKLGQIMKQYRDQRGISMDEFSSLSGLSKGYISLLEKGCNNQGNPIDPTIKTLRAVAKGMGINVNDLFQSLDTEQEVSLSTQEETIFQNQDFTVSSPTRVIKHNAEDFLSSSLYSMTEERETDEDRPSREEILIWLRDHVRMAAFDGSNYENRDDESLYGLYKELKDEAERD